MDINVIVGGLLVATLGYFVAYAFFNADKPPPEHVLPWVPIDVRKTKVYVSQTRDAGMYVERQRRAAILKSPGPPFGYKGFTNGVVEYSLTGILANPFAPGPAPCPPAPNVIWDGGNASTEAVCAIVDGGSAGSEYEIVDFGNADTNVCA